ncbi:helicase associated domain-containing protein [Streptomyces sp. NPDC057496]|uniref:helicase associated domain-containing protein n=1 Tax=Streptomyces sp. NPDC057496 TaxID=3346149 RepID=UPI0036BDB185
MVKQIADGLRIPGARLGLAGRPGRTPPSPRCGCRTRPSRRRTGGRVCWYPLGQWIADQRRPYAAGTLEARRVAELEQLGMVWSEQDDAQAAKWPANLAAARQPHIREEHLRAPGSTSSTR